MGEGLLWEPEPSRGRPKMAQSKSPTGPLWAANEKAWELLSAVIWWSWHGVGMEIQGPIGQ